MTESATQFDRQGRDGERLELRIHSDGNMEISWLPPGGDELDETAWENLALPRHAGQWLIGMCGRAQKLFRPVEPKAPGGK